MQITTKTKQIFNASILEVEVGTTGLRDGDSGHGGRTLLRFQDVSGSNMRVQVAPDGRTVLMTFGGDAELDNLISGLEFALDVLKASRTGGTAEDSPSVSHRSID